MESSLSWLNQNFDWSGSPAISLCAALPPTISQQPKLEISGGGWLAGCRLATTDCPSIQWEKNWGIVISKFCIFPLLRSSLRGLLSRHLMLNT